MDWGSVRDTPSISCDNNLHCYISHKLSDGRRRHVAYRRHNLRVERQIGVLMTSDAIHVWIAKIGPTNCIRVWRATPLSGPIGKKYANKLHLSEDWRMSISLISLSILVHYCLTNDQSGLYNQLLGIDLLVYLLLSTLHLSALVWRAPGVA